MKVSNEKRARIKSAGEVFTPLWIVENMCNLLPAHVFSTETTFLEPSCGDGNFLREILRRRLAHYLEKNGNPYTNALEALHPLYGIELQRENVVQCRKLMQAQLEGEFSDRFGATAHVPLKQRFVSTIKVILEHNIIQANNLTDTPTVYKWEIKGDWIIGTPDTFETEGEFKIQPDTTKQIRKKFL